MLKEGQPSFIRSEFRSFKARKLEEYRGGVRVDLGLTFDQSCAYGINRGENPQAPGRFLVEMISPVKLMQTGQDVVSVSLPPKDIHIARIKGELTRAKRSHTVKLGQEARLAHEQPKEEEIFLSSPISQN